MPADADLIIAGAGCAGLSALWTAMHSQSDRRVVVIDRDFGVGDDRTWAFWGDSSAPFAHLADRTWDRLQVRFPGWESVGRLGGSNGASRPGERRLYHRVRRRDYDAAILEVAADRRNVRFVAQDIVDIRDEANGGVVVMPEGELRAPLVLQSARLSPEDRAARVHHPLRQHFGGWEIRTENPVFEPLVATLMDFDTDQLGATAFFYVLPEARDRALVEFTMFSATTHGREFYDTQIRRHLERIGAGEVSIERSEYGDIPMDDRPRRQQWGRHVWNLGTVGGMTKPTSGYTFQRIHAQARHLIDHWADGTAPTPLPRPPSRFRFADRTLLNILHHRPEQGRPVFERLFRTSAIDDVLTFLDEESTVGADARMVSKLPWMPFLRAAASELGADLSTAIEARR